MPPGKSIRHNKTGSSGGWLLVVVGRSVVVGDGSPGRRKKAAVCTRTHLHPRSGIFATGVTHRSRRGRNDTKGKVKHGHTHPLDEPTKNTPPLHTLSASAGGHSPTGWPKAATTTTTTTPLALFSSPTTLYGARGNATRKQISYPLQKFTHTLTFAFSWQKTFLILNGH